MQYLIKISIDSTEAWRLISVDGKADLAHLAQLIALSFDYKDNTQFFIINGKNYSAGLAGMPKSPEDLIVFDDLSLKENDEFIYKHDSHPVLTHTIKVMKVDEHLFCLMPSCLIGSGLIPNEENLNEQIINDCFDSNELLSLDLREVTSRLRSFGLLRNNVNEALVQAGAVPLNFKVEK